MKVKDGKVIKLEKSDFEDWTDQGNDTEFDDELIIVHDPSIPSRTISDYILGLQEAGSFHEIKETSDQDLHAKCVTLQAKVNELEKELANTKDELRATFQQFLGGKE